MVTGTVVPSAIGAICKGLWHTTVPTIIRALGIVSISVAGMISYQGQLAAIYLLEKYELNAIYINLAVGL